MATDGGDSSGMLQGILDLTVKLRQASVGPALRDLAAGRSPQAPVVVELDPTSYCDLACPECISSPLLNKDRFTDEALVRLATGLADAGVLAVILIGGGEPLLHPATPKIIELLSSRGVKIGLTTNGTRVDRHLDVLAEHVAWTRVSVDAASARTAASFRPTRSGREKFDQVIENMRQLAARKKGLLGFSFLLMSRREPDGRIRESNFGEVEAAARLALDIGCDYFEVKPEYDMGHYLISQDPRLVADLEAQLVDIRALESPTFAILQPKNLSVILAAEQTSQPKDYESCPTAELRTLLTPGGAYVCPYHRGNPAARYGDPASTNFGSLWHGEARADAVRRINPRVDCGFHCIRHEANLELIQISRDGVPTDYSNLPDSDLFL
ncbi:radical SAM protein [Kribbella sp. NPDC023855]|uniref:radical SAM protein n=1 Tax=Kribbella sp. NPDC023855 TaxID=3154698 RepID=UPI0033D05C26